MPLNPIVFTDRVVSSFLRYQLTAYPLADPRLDQQMRDLLSLAKTRSTPLLKGPYLTLSRPFQSGAAVNDLISEGLLHPLMRERIPDAIHNVYKHQEEAIRSIKARQTTLISTGTGSGKTECFLYPVVSKCLTLRDEGTELGVTAILIYPMNALAEDQLLRLRGLLAGTGITFGMYVGKTPHKQADVSGKRLPQGASRADYEKALEDVRVRGTGESVYPAEEVCSREEMRTPGKQPRILLTNVNQLELLLTRQTDVELLSGAKVEFLVFDEAHTFTGAQGAETACLIRRLLQFCNCGVEKATCIATSATMVDPNNPDAAKRFAGRFFGVDPGKVTTVGEAYAEVQWPKDRWVCPAPKNPSKVLEACVKSTTGEVGYVRGAFAALTGKNLDGGDFKASLFAKLSRSQAIYNLARLLEKPLLLNEASAELAVSLQRPVSDEELLSWLVLGALASEEGRPLLRPVVHAFLRGIGGASVSFPPTGSDPVLHFSAEEDPSGDKRAHFPLSTCTTCGQHYFTTFYKDFDHTKRVIGGGQAAGEGRYWEPLASAQGGDRCVLVDTLVSGEDLPSDRVASLWICRSCGTAHDRNVTTCLHCGVAGSAIVLHSVMTGKDNSGYLSKCLSCSAIGRRAPGGFREPARPVRTTAVADIHVLAQDMVNHLDPQRLLIFCDNRQDAAFQAGWMRDHARRFRLRSLLLEELKKSGQTSVGDLSTALSQLLEADDDLSRLLIPEVWRVASKLDAAQNHRKEREKFLRISVLRELTLSPRQVLGLEPWGRLKVEYTGLTPTLPFVVEQSRKLRLPPEELLSGVTSLLDYIRRQKILWDPIHKVYTKFWNDGDYEIQNGYLPKMDPPKGTKLTRAPSDKEAYVLQWLGLAGETFIKQAVRKWGVSDQDLQPLLDGLFDFLCKGGWLVPVNLIGARGTNLPGQSGLYQVDVSKLEIAPGHGVWKCRKCSRRNVRRPPHDLCPAWRCSGTLEFAPEDPDDYNLNLLDGNYDLIKPEEHTAMVPHHRREKIENLFRDPEAKAVNSLVCTQTLEMGVDIGALDAVLMRNVPPLPANYWQRAGRAGRRNRMAVNFTYCRDVSHDRAYFAFPEKLLGGRVDAPTFNMSNPLMVRRHVHAAVLTQLQREGRADDSVKEALSTAFPVLVRSWLFEGAAVRESLPVLNALEQVIAARRGELISDVKTIIADGWPQEDSSVVTEAELERCVSGFARELKEVISRLRRRLTWAHNTVIRLNRSQQQTGTLSREDESIRRRCERYIKRIKGETKRRRAEAEGQDETITFSVLALEGFLPGYGLERGSILGAAEIPFWESSDAGDLSLPRPPLMALREYVPGNLVYANGHRFITRRYQLQPSEEREVSCFEVTVTRSAVREVQPGHIPSQTSRCITSLPMGDVELVHVSQITDEEDYRFQMGVAVLGVERPRHSGGKAYRWADRDIHLLKGQHMRMVNVGSTSEIQRRVNFGYMICSVCGDSVSPMSSDAQKMSFRNGHKERCGGEERDVATEYALHTDIVSDVVKFTGFVDSSEAYSALEALRQAASNCLEMTLEDLQVLVVGHFDSEEVTGYLVDPMPGGSGLLEQFITRFREVHTEALRLVNHCPSGCQSSCIDCLQNYRNSFYHQYLDRNRALQLLESAGAVLGFSHPIPAIQDIGEEPDPGEGPVNTAERRLRRLLLKAGFPEAEWQQIVQLGVGFGYTIPDAMYKPDDEDLKPVAIYLDGLSRHIHGNPETAARDALIRNRLRETGWEVIAITAHELNDSKATSKHFRQLARYLELDDVRESLKATEWYDNSE